MGLHFLFAPLPLSTAIDGPRLFLVTIHPTNRSLSVTTAALPPFFFSTASRKKEPFFSFLDHLLHFPLFPPPASKKFKAYSLFLFFNSLSEELVSDLACWFHCEPSFFPFSEHTPPSYSPQERRDNPPHPATKGSVMPSSFLHRHRIQFPLPSRCANGFFFPPFSLLLPTNEERLRRDLFSLLFQG